MVERKVALVTGSSRGIGAATALQLARQGCDVTINYLANENRAMDVVRQIESLGQKAMAVRADVSDHDQVHQLVDRTARELGGLHVLVNNAGYSSHGTLDELPVEEWRKMMAITLDGAFYCAREAASHMREAGWGRIVNVSSLRAMTGSDHGAHYASAKAGLIGLTKALALELGPDNITVNAVSPGYTETDMNRESIRKKGDRIRARIPVRHIAQPDEIAAVIGFLCSEEAGYIAGETVNANGGIYMG